MAGLDDPLRYKSAWNQFGGDFSNRREIEFYDNQAAEYSGIKGIPLEYYTINVDDYKDGIDEVYGENSRPKWTKKYTLVAILEEFTPEVQAFGGIGLENIDEIVLYFHRSTFDKHVGQRSEKMPKGRIDQRAGFGPVAEDQFMTTHNGLIYEVITGGLHYLSSQEQHFGHKFWYKVTGKVRKVSDASLGEGEQYGGLKDMLLDAKWKGNPQYIIPTPSNEELAGTGTVLPSGTGLVISAETGCVGGDYSTTAQAEGPGTVDTPSDLLTPSGTVADKYIVPGMKDDSKFTDKVDIKDSADEVVDPQTNLNAEVGTPENDKYGPTGRIIKNKRELWNEW